MAIYRGYIIQMKSVIQKKILRQVHNETFLVNFKHCQALLQLCQKYDKQSNDFDSHRQRDHAKNIIFPATHSCHICVIKCHQRGQPSQLALARFFFHFLAEIMTKNWGFRNSIALTSLFAPVFSRPLKKDKERGNVIVH